MLTKHESILAKDDPEGSSKRRIVASTLFRHEASSQVLSTVLLLTVLVELRAEQELREAALSRVTPLDVSQQLSNLLLHTSMHVSACLNSPMRHAQ